MYGKEFWRSTLERTVATGAQTAAALLSVDGLGLLDVDWKALASATGLAMLLAALKALAAGASDGNPSVGSREVVATPVVPRRALDDTGIPDQAHEPPVDFGAPDQAS